MFQEKRRRASVAAAGAPLAICGSRLLGASAQPAATAAPGWAVENFATDFLPGPRGHGPIGIAQRGDGRWITKRTSRLLHRLGPDGGKASDAVTQVTGLDGREIMGLTFDREGCRRLHVHRCRQQDR